MRKNDESLDANQLRPENPCNEQKQCVTNVYCCDDHHDCHDHHKHGCNDDHCCFHEVRPRTCKFDVYISRIRLLDNDFFDNDAEVQVTGYANDMSGITPSGGSYMVINENWGWVNLMKKIGTLEMDRDCKRSVVCRADIVEIDISMAGACEIGSGPPATMYIQCNVHPSPVSTEVEVKRVKENGNVVGKFEVEFMAFQVTP